ncbi:GNAT family N-acetyltransferase [Acinetobacter sp. WCHAc060033]|uniref:GNAT family N-acetyltransferase n=1 Tax=Acinetobacter wuhouensis TaxID=1879050 RepID=A0A3G2T2V8_9GAMM|nr:MULTISPECIES: GNAT family N-acetyltransferase [Acinetobacter]AYO54579.1 GNAT family N-acetyltransferase [Acinetobacter wuhouensis]RZG87528.1 GNAT family N-acetyltransferase [Acinetobacter sp. WCHAc060033]
MNQKLEFRIAQISDIPKLVELVNSAYRHKDGNSWTSEADIVSGDRINYQQLEQSLFQKNFKLFVAELDGKLVACIGLAFDQDNVEVGTFCIAPEYQNQGIGKQVLDFAEKYVIDLKLPNLNDFVMWVLSVRHELIAYYERRGYVQSGVIDEYPIDADVGEPIVDLHLVEMRKVLNHIF